MTGADRERREERVLVLAPTRKDAEFTRVVLDRERAETAFCADLAAVRQELVRGAGAVLLAEEALVAGAADELADWLRRQPPWSDLPILLVARSGADSVPVSRAMERLGNVTVLERPIRLSALVSAVRAALRARQRQYEIRDYLAERERSLEAQARLAAIVESSADAIISKTVEGFILTWNAGAERLFGYSAAEAVGRSITMLIPPERLPEETMILDRLRHGERVEHFETVRVTKDGRRLDISLTVSPIRDAQDRVIGASKVARDISPRKQAERALRESEERFRTLADNISQFAWMADAQGWIFWYNRRWFDYTGTTLDEMQGWGWKQVHHPGHVNRVIEKFSAHLASGQPWEDTFPLRGRDGGYRWFLSRAVPIRDEAGRIVCWFGTNTDVDDQVRAEESLREADRRKDEYLAMLAHELRNPLAAIRNAVQLLLRADRDEQASQWAMEVLDRQVGHMVRQVDDLLDVSRISRGKIELHRERCELSEVVRHAVEAVRPMCENLGHALTIRLPPQPVHLQGDPVRLAQVVSNLLHNACKFTERGGRIQVSLEQEGEQAVLRVQDTGIGLAPSDLRRVFEIFAQVNRSLGRTSGGLGLGLALVKNLVELHGGSVAAHSAGLDQGSEFVVRLPVPPAPPSAPPQPAAGAKPAAAARRRILVVDDNRDSAESLAMLLRLMGHEVNTAHDGLEAIDRTESFRADIVLLDIGMPRLDGYEAARRIRQQRPSNGLRLVALTGWGQDEDRRRSEEAGFDAHLVKPVDLAALRKILAECGVG